MSAGPGGGCCGHSGEIRVAPPPGKPLAASPGGEDSPCNSSAFGRARQRGRGYVATDDARIAEAVERRGAERLMTPSELRSGTGSDRPPRLKERTDAALVVNVQGTNRFFRRDDRPGVRPLLDDPAIVASTLVKTGDGPWRSSRTPPCRKWCLTTAGFVSISPGRVVPHLRDVPVEAWLSRGLFYRHIGLYVFRRRFMLALRAWWQTPLDRRKPGTAAHPRTRPTGSKAVVTSFESTAVDTPEDSSGCGHLLMHGRRERPRERGPVQTRLLTASLAQGHSVMQAEQRSFPATLRSTFLRGVGVIIPLVLTYWVFSSLLDWMDGILCPPDGW